jgi:hypothetical protein
LLPVIFTQAVTQGAIFDWKISFVRTRTHPVVLPASEFATAETSTAVQKVVAKRAQLEFAAP